MIIVVASVLFVMPCVLYYNVSVLDRGLFVVISINKSRNKSRNKSTNKNMNTGLSVFVVFAAGLCFFFLFVVPFLRLVAVQSWFKFWLNFKSSWREEIVDDLAVTP